MGDEGGDGERERRERHMRSAIAEAQAALRAGEVPVGCVLVRRTAGASSRAASADEIVATGHNRTNAECNATRHAEIVAIDSLWEKGGADRLQELGECELYVTVEPCIMCAAALARVGIGRVYFGCHNEKFGGNGSILSLHDQTGNAPHPPGARGYPSTGGILGDEDVHLLKSFYEMGNPNAPKPQRRVIRDPVRRSEAMAAAAAAATAAAPVLSDTSAAASTKRARS